MTKEIHTYILEKAGLDINLLSGRLGKELEPDFCKIPLDDYAMDPWGTGVNGFVNKVIQVCRLNPDQPIHWAKV